MSIRIAVNGFGRIGRLALRAALQHEDIEIIAINDLVSIKDIVYLFKYDSTHGTFPGSVEAFSDYILLNGKKIHVYSEKDPEKLPWQELRVDYVIESTGFFTKKEDAEKHLKAGAKRVVITAPVLEDVSTFVMGVNHEKFDPRKDKVISNASCTTNCLAPLIKVLIDEFGVEEGLMTTIHAITATQSIVDGSSKRRGRGGRGALQNIIPESTGAAKAVVSVIPEIEGKLTGMSFRVPVADVCAIDLTVRLTKKTSYESIAAAMKKASDGSLKGILGYTEEEVVSSDFISSPYSAIFDKGAGIALNDTFFKLIAWYDNETGYATRVIDLLRFIATKENH